MDRFSRGAQVKFQGQLEVPHNRLTKRVIWRYFAKSFRFEERLWSGVCFQKSNKRFRFCHWCSILLWHPTTTVDWYRNFCWTPKITPCSNVKRDHETATFRLFLGVWDTRPVFVVTSEGGCQELAFWWRVLQFLPGDFDHSVHLNYKPQPQANPAGFFALKYSDRNLF